MIKILGIFDAIAGIIFLFTHFFSVPSNILLIVGAYLILKGTLFSVMAKDIASILDVIAGLYALVLTLGVHSTIVTTIVILYLGQKAAFSLLRL